MGLSQPHPDSPKTPKMPRLTIIPSLLLAALTLLSACSDPDAAAPERTSGKPVVYAPAIWGAILFVIRALPRFVMRRIAF